MSVRPTRLVVSTGAAALALGLLSPTVALADNGNGHGNGSGDPAGNNGTIKIDPYGGTDGNANHPHPGCDFRLQLFGFDAGQTGTITFSGQAPTRDAVTAQPLPGTQHLSDDAAGGGQDRDASFDIRGSQLGLTGTPQAQQGFHIRVEVNADGAPGGAKTKVFWLSCPSTGTSSAGTTEQGGTQTGTSDSGGTAEQAGTTAPAGGTTSSTSTRSTLSQGVTSGAATAPATGEAQPATSAATGSESAPGTFTGGSAAAVRSTGRTGAPAARGLALPFTGLPVAGLIALGLGAAAAGGLAIAAGRRRTSVVDQP